jgi:hypothetical protein
MAYRSPRISFERYRHLSWEEITTTLSGLERQQALAAWQWAAYHYSSLAPCQARYWRRYGTDATIQRINKVREWLTLPPID